MNRSPSTDSRNASSLPAAIQRQEHIGVGSHNSAGAVGDGVFSDAHTSAANAELSEYHAALFLIGVLRESAWLRWRFPRALSDGVNGSFCRWVCRVGPRRFRLSERAVRKIRGAFRRQFGNRVRNVFLHDPELQRLFPWGLMPFGQQDFVAWLSTFGRTDQNLTTAHILWFRQESAEDAARALALTYLVRPDLQERFPAALTSPGWPQFFNAMMRSHAAFLGARATKRQPTLLSPIQQRYATRSIADAERSDAVEGVNIVSHFCNPSGIQQAAMWTKAAFERAGLETSCRDVPVPRKERPIDRDSWLGLEPFPFTVLTHAATPYFASGYERSGLWRRPGVYRIAYWAWELAAVPDEWVEVAPLVDEIWAPTEFVAEAMRRRMPRAVYDMLPGVEVTPVEPVARAEFNIPQEHCVFLFMFDLHSQLHRKNPAGVVRAFKDAFRADDAATLVIKASGGDIHHEDLARLQELCRGENIILIHELMTRPRAYGLIAMCDCFVSLHRSEGFGLGLAEAMLLGKPAIGTGYSGNLAFMNRENSMLVDFEMVEIDEDRPIYTRGNQWAEPSIAHAAAHMRYVYENRGEASARAAAVQPQIQQLLSLEAAGRRMRTRLEEIARAGYKPHPQDAMHRVGIEPTTQ